MIALLVFTDGRDELLAQTLASADDNLCGPITRRVIYDDTGSEDHRRSLFHAYPGCQVVWHQDGRQGFGGAIRAAWAALDHPDTFRPADERFVFHLEDDFTFNRPVDLAAMATVLDRRPHLAQLALRRQPWNDEERGAGGIVEQHPDDFREVSDADGYVWLEHRRFFTTNPSLYRRALCASSWPTGPNSEGRFTHQLLQDHDLRFGYWGARDSGEAVTHIGRERAGVGY